MNRIIFATGNAGKMKEIREILGDMDAEIQIGRASCRERV